EPREPRRIDERVRHYLVRSETDERVTQPLAELFEWMRLDQRQGAIGDAGRQPVVAHDAPDLLDDILGDADVRADDRRPRDERVALGAADESQSLDDVQDLLTIAV